MLVVARSTPVRSRLSERQNSHGWSDPAGRNSAGCNPMLMTVDVSCSRVSHISSLVLLGDAFSVFVKFMKPFYDFNRLIADMCLYSWCFASAVGLGHYLRLATVRLMSAGAMPVSRCRLSMLVGFWQPATMRQQSCKAELTLFASVDLAQTALAYSATE